MGDAALEVQPPAGWVNTYNAPWALLAPTVARGAPTTTVEPSPDIASADPETGADSVAVSVPDVHPPGGLTNT